MPSGMIYLIRAGDLYKIGMTRNLLFRMREIGTEVRMSIWLLHTWPTETPRALEYYMHGMFAECRLTGEWFRLGYHELERLRRINLTAKALPSGPTPALPEAINPDTNGNPMCMWREDRGLSQADVARECGVSPNTIARLEQGVHLPRSPLLKKLLELTGLPLNDLLVSAVTPPQKRPRGRPKGSRRPRKPDA